MFKAIKDNKIIAINETGVFPCLVHDTIIEDDEHSVSDYIEDSGEFVLKTDDAGIAAQNEQIRQQREARFIAESDPLRMDYDEALARGQDNAEELKQIWLASKDVIRADLPYIVEG